MTIVKINIKYYIRLLQSTNDTVFSPTSPSAGDFVVDFAEESTNQSLGISIFCGADTAKGPSAVFIKALSPDGLAACDGRLCAGKTLLSKYPHYLFSPHGIAMPKGFIVLYCIYLYQADGP